MDDELNDLDAATARDVLEMRLAGSEARANADWKGMVAAGGELERLGCFADAWNLFADAVLLRRPQRLQEWMGEDIRGDCLLVERRMRHTGAELRMARFLAPASTRAGSVVACVEDRLVPLLRRSFPEVEIALHDDAAARQIATRGASYERLAQFLGADANAIAASFRPLCPPPEVLARIVRGRDPGERPVIGIAWHSTNERKPLPALADWAALLGRADAHFVSLQYNEANCGIAELAQAASRSIEDSGVIDQMKDIDGFSAQVASVDAVVTISNTTAHMAGALGIPCWVLLDNLQHLVWPRMDATTPFYPSVHLVRQGARSWSEVLISIADAIAAVPPRWRTNNT